MPTSYVVSLLNAIRVATGLTVRAVYEGHVQYVPEWRPILTFAQVTAFSPGVCKTVGYAFPGSNPGLATTSGNGPWPGYSRARVTMWVGPKNSDLAFTRDLDQQPTRAEVAATLAISSPSGNERVARFRHRS